MGGRARPLILLPARLFPGSSPPFWAHGWTSSQEHLSAPDSLCLKQLVAYVQLNMPGSDLEHCTYLPWTLLEDLDPPTVRNRGVGVYGCVGMGQCWAPPGEALRGWGQEQRLDSEHPADGQQSGRRAGESSFLSTASLGGSGLCKHRSVSDLGASGGVGRRTVRMAGQGCDASRPATSPCLCRTPQMTLGGSWQTPIPSPSQRK